MLDEYEVEFHPEFFDDLKKYSNRVFSFSNNTQ